jgi:peptide/nickel transport system substrate-binding protein
LLLALPRDAGGPAAPGRRETKMDRQQLRSAAWQSGPDILSGLSRRHLLAGGAATGLLLAGVTARAQSAAAQPPAKPVGQVVVGLSQEPTVFNPLMVAIEVDQGVWWNLFNPLWGVEPDGTFTPQLATEIPSLENGGVSADGLHWRVRLRSGVTWHDGAPFTADDLKFTFDLLNNPNFRAGRRTGYELVRDFTIISPTEVTWRMERPYAPFISILAWTFVVPQHLLAKAADPNTAPFNNAPVGTGPFRWGERQPGDHVTLLANAHYFGKGPYLERVVFKYIPDLTVLYTQFRTGDIDYIGLQGITPDHYQEARTLPGRNVMPIPQGFVESITLNLGRPQFQDKAVREALYDAMDKDSIIKEIYYGLPRPTESYLPQQSWAYNPDLPAHEYNPDRAKQILDAAGWKPGPGGVRQKNGIALRFDNSTTAGNHVREQAQQLLQQNWQDIGAAMTIRNMPAAVIWGDFYADSKFDSVMVGEDFLTGPDPDVAYYFDSHSIPAKGGAGDNTMQYINPEVDKLLELGQSSVDQTKRKAAYLRLQSIIRDDLPLLPIFQYAMVEGTKGKLMGYRANINTQSNCWNIGQWYWAG